MGGLGEPFGNRNFSPGYASTGHLGPESLSSREQLARRAAPSRYGSGPDPLGGLEKLDSVDRLRGQVPGQVIEASLEHGGQSLVLGFVPDLDMFLVEALLDGG